MIIVPYVMAIKPRHCLNILTLIFFFGGGLMAGAISVLRNPVIGRKINSVC